VLLLAASGLALAGCKIDNRPLLARSGPPPAAALPPPGPIEPGEGPPIYPASAPVAPGQAYPYAERAYALDRTFYETPPDSGFYYGEEEPWVWETADDALMFAEPYGDDYRFYYYEPDAPYPYFVRDADYGYAYGPDGALIALFSAAGALLSGQQYERAYPEARQYWTRGRDMYRDYGRAPRQVVNRTAWSQRAPRLQAARQTWIQAPAEQPAWRRWRSSDAGRMAVQRAQAVRPARAAPVSGAPRIAAIRPDEARQRGRMSPGGRDQARQVATPSAEAHGRLAAARAPIAPASRAQGHEHGRGHAAATTPAPPAHPVERRAATFPANGHGVQGGRGRGRAAAPSIAQAAPAPRPDAEKGHRGREAAAQPHPQAAAQAAQPHGGSPGAHAHGAAQGQGAGHAHGAPHGGQPQGGGGHDHGKHGH